MITNYITLYQPDGVTVAYVGQIIMNTNHDLFQGVFVSGLELGTGLAALLLGWRFVKWALHATAGGSASFE